MVGGIGQTNKSFKLTNMWCVVCSMSWVMSVRLCVCVSVCLCVCVSVCLWVSVSVSAHHNAKQAGLLDGAAGHTVAGGSCRSSSKTSYVSI
jgi:hypothetical protein